MRVELRVFGDPQPARRPDALDEIFANHAMLLNCALDLLAVSWRSERLREEQGRLGGVGAPGGAARGADREPEARSPSGA